VKQSPSRAVGEAFLVGDLVSRPNKLGWGTPAEGSVFVGVEVADLRVAGFHLVLDAG
jgi:hypothetical protein